MIPVHLYLYIVYWILTEYILNFFLDFVPIYVSVGCWPFIIQEQYTLQGEGNMMFEKSVLRTQTIPHCAGEENEITSEILYYWR